MARRTRIGLAATIAMLALAGCGDGGGGGGRAAELTRWLPPDGLSYTAVDLAAYKEELDLAEDADPMTNPRLASVGQTPFAFLFPEVEPEAKSFLRGEGIREGLGLPRTDILDAVGPRNVTAAASVTGKDYADEGPVIVAAYATTADTGEIGSALGDLGYRDSGGVLEGDEAWPAIRLEEGLVLASMNGDALRSIPDEPADDMPLELLDEIEGDDIAANGSGYDCVRQSMVAASVDGSAEIAFLVEGEADPGRVEPVSSLVDEPEADGHLVSAEVSTDGLQSARAIQAKLLPGYDC